MALLFPSEARGSAGASQTLSCLRAFEQELGFLYRTLRRYGVQPADLEDLAQEVFLVMWRRWPEYDQARPVRPWLRAIACHLALKHLSKRGREVQRADVDRPDDTLLPDDRLASARAQSLAQRALAALPDRHRAALAMHELDGVPVRDLASRWSVPLFTAYSRLRAARRAFSRVVTRLQPRTRRWGVGLFSGRAVLVRDEVSPPAAPGAGAHFLAWIRGQLLRPLILASVAAVAILAAGVSQLVADGGRAGAESGATLAFPSHTRSGSTLRGRGTPPRLLASAPPAETRDLLGRWSFDEEAGSSVARDSSGHRRDCLVRGLHAGSRRIEGVSGGALHFDAGGWLECPLPDKPDGATSELTVTAWIAPGPPRRGIRAIASRARVAGHGEHFFFGIVSGKLRLYSTPWHVEIEHPLPQTSDPWMHVAFTQGQDGLAKIYLDGVEVGQSAVNRRFQAQMIGPLRVGAGTLSAAGPSLSRPRQTFRGSIDEVRVYQRALTKTEVAALASRNFP